MHRALIFFTFIYFIQDYFLLWIETHPWIFDTCISEWVSGGWHVNVILTLAYLGVPTSSPEPLHSHSPLKIFLTRMQGRSCHFLKLLDSCLTAKSFLHWVHFHGTLIATVTSAFPFRNKHAPPPTHPSPAYPTNPGREKKAQGSQTGKKWPRKRNSNRLTLDAEIVVAWSDRTLCGKKN